MKTSAVRILRQPGHAGVSRLVRLLTAAGLVLLLAGHVMVNPAVAEGFRNPPPGTLNLGRSGGRIAQIDDASAVQQNPANLVDIPAEIDLTPTVVFIKADFTSPTGQSGSTKDPWKFLPNGFASTPLMEGNLALGIGLTTPYGLGNEWDTDSSAFARPAGVLRYSSPYSAELETININPAASLRLGDSFRLGAGLDIMWSQVTLKQFYPWFLFPGSALTTPDGHLEAKGDGTGLGFNAGLTWLITERQRLALTYRSPMDVDYDGHVSLDNITPLAAALGATARSPFSTSVGFPTIVAAGYGIQLSDTFRIEADVEWLQFSRFKSLDLKVGNNAFLLPGGTSFRQDWKDTFTAGIGADWRFANNWVLRAGYQFYQTPVPDKTFSPTIPDADQNVFTVGIGYKYKHHFLEAAYGADFYDTRHIAHDQTAAFNGTYEITVHLFSFSYHYSF